MPLAYPGTNPSQAWANQLVDAVNGATAGTGAMWSGTLAANKAIAASTFTSLLMSTPVEYTGANSTPDLPLTWTGDCFSVPQAGYYELTLLGDYAADSSGNRMVAFIKNPPTTTLATSSATLNRFIRFAPTTDTTGGQVTWKTWLEPTDKIMAVARSSVAITVNAGGNRTCLTVELRRTTR